LRQRGSDARHSAPTSRRGGAVPAPFIAWWTKMARQLFQGVLPSGHLQSSKLKVLVQTNVWNSRIIFRWTKSWIVSEL